MRRGIRRGHAVLLLVLRRRDRAAQARPRGRDYPRLRPEPHRAGHRVRLHVCARRAGTRQGLRHDHGQLQPRDRLDRLRHVGPPLLRAAHVRRRDRDLRSREEDGSDQGCDRAARRPDAAFARRATQGRRRADSGHDPRIDRPGRKPRAVRRSAARGEAQRAALWHGAQPRGGARRRALHRLPGARAPELRARRPRHGNRLRRRAARKVCEPRAQRSQGRHGGVRAPAFAAAHRQVPAGRDRDRRRRAVRR